MTAEAMIRSVNKLMAPVSRAMRGMVLRGVITLVNDAAALQRVQLQTRAMPQASGGIGHELISDIEVMSHYGFTSVPLAGAEAVVLSVGGVRAHGLVVAVGDRRYRMTGLESGDVALHDHRDQYVLLTAAGIVIKGTAMTVDVPTVHFTGDATIDGTLTVAGMNVNTHTHKVDAVGQQTEKGIS